MKINFLFSERIIVSSYHQKDNKNQLKSQGCCEYNIVYFSSLKNTRIESDNGEDTPQRK